MAGVESNLLHFDTNNATTCTAANINRHGKIHFIEIKSNIKDLVLL